MAQQLLTTRLISQGAYTPSASVLAARSRREQRSIKQEAEVQWFIDQVSQKISIEMEKRVRLATEFLKTRIVRNISIPVGKGQRVYRDTYLDTITGKTSNKRRTKTYVTERSKPGEFPRADTTQLMKTIFTAYRKEGGDLIGFVGTPLDYGLILEVRMKRSFLIRTMQEESDKLRAILTGPVPGGSGTDYSYEKM